MGWSGHRLYDGDGTQSTQVWFMSVAGWKDTDAVWKAMQLPLSDEEIVKRLKSGRRLLPFRSTLTQPMKECLVKNIDKVLKKMPKLTKFGFKNEGHAIDWQMLLALFSDNKLVPPKIVFDNGILATEYLLGTHANDFNEPAKRKAVLRRFIKRVRKMFGGISMR